MVFRELHEGNGFRIKCIDENLVKRGATALRYNQFGVFLGRLEMTNETEVTLIKEMEDAT